MQRVRGVTEWLYVVGPPESGFVKIGCSRNPRRRLAELQTAARSRRRNTVMPRSIDSRALMVLYQQPGDQDLERGLHAHFTASWVMGEWFALGTSAVERVREAINHLHSLGRTSMSAPFLGAARPANSDAVYLMSAAGPAHRWNSGRQWRTLRAGCGTYLAGARKTTFAAALGFSIPLCDRCFPTVPQAVAYPDGDPDNI